MWMSPRSVRTGDADDAIVANGNGEGELVIRDDDKLWLVSTGVGGRNTYRRCMPGLQTVVRLGLAATNGDMDRSTTWE